MLLCIYNILFIRILREQFFFLVFPLLIPFASLSVYYSVFIQPF